jgi:hypothetical protein
VYNFKVLTSLARQVYIAEKLAPPTNLNTWINAYTKIWSSAVSPNYWKSIAQNGQWAKVGVYVSWLGDVGIRMQWKPRLTRVPGPVYFSVLVPVLCLHPYTTPTTWHKRTLFSYLPLSADTGSRGIRSLQDRRDHRTKELGRIQVARVDPCLALYSEKA